MSILNSIKYYEAKMQIEKYNNYNKAIPNLIEIFDYNVERKDTTEILIILSELLLSLQYLAKETEILTYTNQINNYLNSSYDFNDKTLLEVYFRLSELYKGKNNDLYKIKEKRKVNK